MRRTFDTASKGPLTFRIRSGLPGMLSETMTRAPLFSRISLTCFPPRPMMIDASCVTIKQRMCIMADGATGALDEDVGPAALVAEVEAVMISVVDSDVVEFSPDPFVFCESAPGARPSKSPDVFERAVGVDAAVSVTAFCASAIGTSFIEDEAAVGADPGAVVI